MKLNYLTKSLVLFPLVLWWTQNSGLAQTYCTPIYPSGCTPNNKINTVNIGAYTDASTACAPTSVPAVNIIQGSTPTVSVSTLGWVGIGASIDLNHDGFLDTTSSEVVYAPNYIAVSPGLYTFTLPSIPNGSYRFRIWCWGGNSGSGSLNSCNASGYGNYRDYTLNYQPPMTYLPVQLTAASLNADVVANGLGIGTAVTNNDIDGANYVYVANGWQQTTTSAAYANGLPANGILNTAATSTPGLTFKFAPWTTPYTGNNVLRLSATGPTSGTLALATTPSALSVFLLATSGSGTGYFTGQINFTDNSNQPISTATLIPDWYNGTTPPYAVAGIGRLNRTTNALDASSGTPGNPRIYQIEIPILAANQNKAIASIQVTRSPTSAAGAVLDFFAVTIAQSTPATCAAPTTATATAITATTALLDWTQTGTPTQWQIKYGPAGFNVNTAGTSVFTSTKPYTLNPPLTPATAYSYYVRAICGPNDTSAWSAMTNFTTLCVPPTIISKTDSFNCGPGAVVLKALASTGGSIKWYAALTGGTALFTGGVFTTPALTASTTYYIAAASGTCESTPRQAVVADIRPIPVVNIGNDTTICPGIAYTMDAGNPGANYNWNTGAITQSIAAVAPGNYSVQVTVNGCSASDSRAIVAGIVPQNNLSAALDLCTGNTIMLDAGNTGSSFLWSPGGETTQTIDVSTGGVQSVTIRSTTGCEINSSTAVVLRPLPVVDLGNDTAFCRGNTLILDAGNTGADFLWNTGATSQTLNVDTTGSYSVLVTDNYICKASDTINVVVKAPPSGTINAVYGEAATYTFNVINPQFITSYAWDFGDGSPLGNGEQVQHQYIQNGIYTVSVKLQGDCNDSLLQSRTVDVFDGQETGIVNQEETKGLLLYPNPASTQIAVDNKNTAWKPGLYHICNTVGIVVLTGKFNGSTQHINVGILEPGIYYIHIITDKGFVVRRFEVQK